MQSNISIWVLYKVITLSVGLLCTYMGYRLLLKGIFDGGSDITAAWSNDKKLIIKRASPGVIFALVGFGIIVINFVVSGYSFKATSNHNGPVDSTKTSYISAEKGTDLEKDNFIQIYCITPSQLEQTKTDTTSAKKISKKNIDNNDGKKTSKSTINESVNRAINSDSNQSAEKTFMNDNAISQQADFHQH
ncbi:hypothetical protein I5496_02075 [Citrobacter freundii]|uniref:hypothetical protein n=1 Tax=Citrobacter freundii TaxID=546 RepID=UPI001903F1B9|nr:hypothetical protein [Citrobacter freundii]MBJ9306993.1 hypothetical protein [Citrobacter freundii]